MNTKQMPQNDATAETGTREATPPRRFGLSLRTFLERGVHPHDMAFTRKPFQLGSMSTLAAILDRCCDPLGPCVDDLIPSLLSYVPSAVTLPDMLRTHMGPYLMAQDGKIRGRATSVLAGLLRIGGAPVLTSSKAASIDAGTVAEALFEFFCGRLADGPR